MRILPVTQNYLNTYNSNIKRQNSAQNFQYGCSTDVVMLSGEGVSFSAKPVKLEKDTELYNLCEKLYKNAEPYRREAIDYFNTVRVYVSDILSENGFNPKHIYNCIKKGSTIDRRFKQLLKNPTVPNEQGYLYFGTSDIITLPSRKHPNITLKFEKANRNSFNSNETNFPARFIYEDEKLEFNDKYAHLTLDDGTVIHFCNPIRVIDLLDGRRRLGLDKKIDTLATFCGPNNLSGILDYTNNVYYLFRTNQRTDTLIGIRDFNNWEATFLNEKSLTPESAFQIYYKSPEARKYDLNYHINFSFLTQ